MEVKLPKTTEEEMDSVIVFWHKSENDFIEKGEVLVEVQTEKAVFEIEAPVSGRIEKILVSRGEVASVGEVLATISDADSENKSFVQASPHVRRLAKQLGVDLTRVRGTGANGRPTEQDVREAAQVQYQPSATSPGSREKSEVPQQISAIRKTIARRMMESLQETAQLTLTAWADVTDLSEQKESHHLDLSWNTWILRAVILTIQEHTSFNAVWEKDRIKEFSHIHLGIAVDTNHGLMVPVIQNAHQLTLSQLDKEVGRLVSKSRDGQLSGKDLSGSTFTVTNLGAYSVQFFTPIINPPEAAILGVGQIEPNLFMDKDRQIKQKMRLPLSFTFDHRINDGGPAAAFLKTLSDILSHPEKLT